MEVQINVYPQQQNVEIVTEPNVTNINVTTYAVINPQFYDLSEFTNTEVDRFAKLSDIVSSIAGYATEAWVNSRGFITNVITALGFTPENVANKNTSTSLGTSDSLYPTQNAVKTYVDTGLSAKQNSLGFTPENVANKENTTLDTSTTKYPTNRLVKEAVDAKQNSLGFTPENVANKATSLASPNNTTYPTTQAVADGLALKQNTLTNPITGTLADGQVAFGTTTNVIGGDNGLFWDNTNKRLGVGTNVPATNLTIQQGNQVYTPLDLINFETALGISSNSALISGMDFKNFNNVGQVRLMARNNANDYLAINSFGSNSTGTFFGINRNNVNAIFSVGSLDQTKKLLIGTFNNGDVIIGTNNLERLRVLGTNGNTGIGTTLPVARLDVRAQGALSTDIAFRVRNSVDTINFLTVNGLGDVFNNGAGGVNTNTFFGENVGRLTAGGSNSFFGQGAGLNNTTGANNSFFGRLAGTSNTTGASNTAIGVNALFSNTTGISNIAIGVNALFSNTTANNNTAIGLDALRFTTTGASNTAIGLSALRVNTTGANNTSVGAAALFSNTTGGSNTSIGVSTLFNLATGSSNTAIGFEAGRRISSGSDLTISNNSVFLGQDTRALADNQTNQIVIGHNAIGAGSNTATLGNTSIVKTILRGTLNAANLPTSAAGLVAGDIWNNGGVLNIV